MAMVYVENGKQLGVAKARHVERCGELLLLLLLLREAVGDEAAALGWGQIMKTLC